MFGKRVLVTGASGFIGQNLVNELLARGAQVTCLIRQHSKIDDLKTKKCRFVVGDVEDRSALSSAVVDQDFVFHLAALTNARTKQRQFQVNVGGCENLLSACAAAPQPPTFILISSLAAVGPDFNGQPHRETDPCHPVSNYGCSKRATEQIAARFADQVPISIVRPPIVLGAGDREGLILFKMLQQLGLHLIPGYRDCHVSVVHCCDLINALIQVALRGDRLSASDTAMGVYFASADERLTYRRLAEMIGQAVGQPRIRFLYVPRFAVRAVGSVNSAINFLFHRSQFFNRDKSREAIAGSWSCSNEKIKHELDWHPELPLAERLHQIALWYRQHDWLPTPPRRAKSLSHSRSSQSSPPELN